jgi:hypothetical protein
LNGAASACYTRTMADDKPAPREFPVEVAVGGIRVTVTLLLKPGTEVSVVGQETKEQRSDGDRDDR